MRNYVIINGVNSLTIQGLAINIMPPISKPPMRTLREEIDGRDGDITTELGYGAYDRTLEVGLYGNYDINEVIAFFNSKGTIVFSDEDDKYYNFEITDRIDYSKLVKFRTASINFHCQPFKYPLNETPLEEEYEYVEGEGTELTLNDTANTIFNKFDLLGNTSQDGTPTPSSPIPVNVVSGDNEINICGKNLLQNSQNANTTTYGMTLKTNEDGSVSLTGTPTNSTIYFTNIKKIPVSAIQSGNYTISFSNDTIYNFLSYRLRKYDGTTRTNIKAETPINSVNYKFTIDLKSLIDSNTTEVELDLVRYGTTAQDLTIYPMLEKGSTATTYEPYIGSSYPIYLGVENLLNYVDNLRTDYRGLTSTINADGSITTTGIPLYNYTSIIGYDITSSLENGATYTLWQQEAQNNVLYLQINIVNRSTGTTTYVSLNNSTSGTFIADTINNTYTLNLQTGTTTNWGSSSKTITNFYQLEKSSKANHYTPYGTTPIELCKIGTYQDYIYKDNGSWYLHKEIGKVVLDGSHSGLRTPSQTSGNYRMAVDIGTNILSGDAKLTAPIYSDKFIGINRNQSYAEVQGIAPTDTAFNYKSLIIYCDATKNMTYAEFQTWLSTNNVLVYYVLATSTNTLIEDTTLIEQLESLSIANSIQGQTNISQENNDLPFILSVSTLKDGSDHLVINNIGNIYAKPTLDLEGNGIVDIYLNDTQMFEVDLSETNEIVINTQDMEAYNPTTNALANRQVTGDYSKFKLDSGENDLRFSGALTKATITNYQRWL